MADSGAHVCKNVCKNAGMSAPEPQRRPLLPPHLLKLLAIAFAVGLVLFLLIWLNRSDHYDFYKANVGDEPAEPSTRLPAPLPPDLARSGDASGLTLPATAPAAPPPPPARPIAASPPPPAQAVTPTAATSDRTVPEPLTAPAPRYPMQAMRRHVGGTVRVRATVATDGSVERTDIASGSGNRDLDRAALDAVRRWTFKPATRNGQVISMEVVIPVVFDPGN